MSLFPKIHSPCPYKSNLSSFMDGDHCRACNKQVHDISFMSEGDRKDFLADCSGDVCVSYRTLGRVATAAAATGLMAFAVPAAAQDTPAADTPAATEYDYEDMNIIVGGISFDHDVQWEEHQDAALPPLPEVTESDKTT